MVLEGPAVELSPVPGVRVTLGEMVPPPPVPVHVVGALVSLHQVKVTEPVGAPPVELPVTVAESLHELPTEVLPGALMVVETVGVAGFTVTHSLVSTVPVMLSVDAL